MILLFTDNTGDNELKELLGFLDADLRFKNMKSDIIEATNEVVDLIGQEMYDLALIAYKKLDTEKTQDDQDLLFAMRYPIAIEGYRKFAPNSDLAHTNKGRVTRIEDKEQAAFEWMIERDNVAMERKYFRALDNLIKYLDVKGGQPWKDTDAFKSTQQYFVRTTKDFDDVYPIGKSRLLLIKLMPGIRLAENREIHSRIGKVLFDDMKSKLEAGDAVTDPELLKKIKEAECWRAMAFAMRTQSVQLFPEGVLQSFVSDRLTIKSKQVPIKSEAEGAAQNFDKAADQVLGEIEAIITKLNYVESAEEDPPYPTLDEENEFVST